MRSFLILAVSLFIGSCGSTDERESFSDQLIGSWFLECDESISGVYTFSDIEYTGDTVEYEQEDCSGEIIEESSFSAIYSIGDAVRLSNDVTAYRIFIEASAGDQTISFWDLMHIDDDRLYSGVDSAPEEVPTAIDFSTYFERM